MFCVAAGAARVCATAGKAQPGFPRFFSCNGNGSLARTRFSFSCRPTGFSQFEKFPPNERPVFRRIRANEHDLQSISKLKCSEPKGRDVAAAAGRSALHLGCERARGPLPGRGLEHEFDGKARATAYGLDVPAPSLKGDSGVFELGVSFKPSPTPAFPLIWPPRAMPAPAGA